MLSVRVDVALFGRRKRSHRRDLYLYPRVRNISGFHAEAEFQPAYPRIAEPTAESLLERTLDAIGSASAAKSIYWRRAILEPLEFDLTVALLSILHAFRTAWDSSSEFAALIRVRFRSAALGKREVR